MRIIRNVIKTSALLLTGAVLLLSSCVKEKGGNSEPVDPESLYLHVSEIRDLATSSSKAEIFEGNLKGMRITSVYSKYIVAQDATAAILMYIPNLPLKTGDLVSGQVKGNVIMNNGNPQISSIDLDSAMVSHPKDPLPLETVTADELTANPEKYMFHRVLLKSLTVEKGVVEDGSAEESTGEVSQLGNTAKLNVYSQGKVSLEATDQGNLVAFPAYRKEELFLMLYNKKQWIPCEPAMEDTPFTRSSLIGEYKIQADTAINVKAMPDSCQRGYIVADELTSFRYMNFASDAFARYSLNSKNIHSGEKYTLEIYDAAGIKSVPVTCVNYYEYKAWLKTDDGTSGYLISVSPRSMEFEDGEEEF